MKSTINPTRTAILGLGSGMLWSLLVGWFGHLYGGNGDILILLAAGAITGATVALLEYYPLRRCRAGWSVPLLAIIGLPVAGYIFGLIFSALHCILPGVGMGGHDFFFAEVLRRPFLMAWIYSYMSLASMWADIFFVPASLATTVYFWLYLNRRLGLD